ncbi:MAG: hypothetical protein PHP93_02365 [Kiritimatiellales bacterium]|nr:hypothetical protein [Kiritimatiellales bacterium]
MLIVRVFRQMKESAKETKTEGVAMDRRLFVKLIVLTGAAFSAGNALAAKITHGHCGAKCGQCDQQKDGACGGCGTGEKAQCIVFKCNSRKNMDTCASCKANPCVRHKKISPPKSARA